MPDRVSELTDETNRLITAWEQEDRVARLWAGDPTLWSGADEAGWLGWLHVIDHQRADLEPLRALQQETGGGRFQQVVLLGMGGSSLCPDVLRRSFGQLPGAPDLHVLDSTDPAQVRALDRRIGYSQTLFIVSSKSGTTLEPTILHRYFAMRAREELAEHPGSHFVAVTDPGSTLDELGTTERFRQVFHGVPNIGGRFSALSYFGTVPAAVMGIDVDRYLTRAANMQTQCKPETPLRENPGAMLGLTLGAAAEAGRDKVTLVISPAYQALGSWLEQLLAESTGKDGRGIIPVDGEPVGPPEVYGDDRLFVYLRDEGAPERGQDDAVDRLAQAGHPVIRVDLRDRYDLGAEFFRWEFATAVAGSILGINPFDQPDVEASKVETRRLTSVYEAEGQLPSAPPLARDGSLTLFSDPRNGSVLRRGAASMTVAALVRAQCERISKGDYAALLAYVDMTGPHAAELQRARLALRDAFGVATCVGFGPRFLHSTGQAYKGGPNSGVFFQITCDDAVDIPVPGRGYSFGVVKTAQAHGDFQVLVDRERRVLRVHIAGDVRQGLRRFADLVETAVGEG